MTQGRRGTQHAPPFQQRLRRQLVGWAIGESRLGQPRRILRVWPLWERVARRIWPVIEVPHSKYGLVGLHFTRYHGDPFSLPDGVTIRSGDPVGEIHLNNQALVRHLGEGRGADKFLSVTMVRDDLAAVARWSNREDFPQPIVAIYGVSILSRGATRLGFAIRPAKPGLRTALDRLFMDGLLVLYTPEGIERLRGRTASDNPDQVWMSMDELRSRYGESEGLGSVVKCDAAVL